MNRRTNGRRDRQTSRQADIQTNIQIDRQTDRQTVRNTFALNKKRNNFYRYFKPHCEVKIFRSIENLQKQCMHAKIELSLTKNLFYESFLRFFSKVSSFCQEKQRNEYWILNCEKNIFSQNIHFCRAHLR